MIAGLAAPFQFLIFSWKAIRVPLRPIIGRSGGPPNSRSVVSDKFRHFEFQAFLLWSPI
jgi:hypothetical protein